MHHTGIPTWRSSRRCYHAKIDRGTIIRDSDVSTMMYKEFLFLDEIYSTKTECSAKSRVVRGGNTGCFVGEDLYQRIGPLEQDRIWGQKTHFKPTGTGLSTENVGTSQENCKKTRRWEEMTVFGSFFWDPWMAISCQKRSLVFPPKFPSFSGKSERFMESGTCRVRLILNLPGNLSFVDGLMVSRELVA